MKRLNEYLVLILFTLLCAKAYALPLSIDVLPGTTLPNQYLLGGGTDKSIYIVSNLTRSVRQNVYVAYLPVNVSQVFTDSNVNSLCASTFTLQPNGSNGSSCALELVVFGTVNGNDPNRFQHLFVCLSDRTTCVGPPAQLNVAATDGVIVGNYSTADEPSLPLLLTTNSRSSWVFVDVTKISGIPNFAPLINTLSSASCFGNICVVGGSYSTANGNLLPLLLVRLNNSQSWSYVNTALISGLPNFGAINQINKVNCSGNVCIAAGIWQNSAQTMNLPLLLTSQNLGFSWNYIDIAKVQNAPTFSAFGSTFLGATCLNKICVVVGSYGTGSSTGGTSRSNITANPLLLTSNNAGLTWTSINVRVISGVPSFGTGNLNQLRAVSCNDNGCVAVGSYTSANNLFILPLILVSNKQAQNWVSINPANITNLPANVFVGTNQLTNVSCSNTVCIATGNYSVPSTGNLLPLLLVSHNNGNSWQFVNTTLLPGVPTIGAFSLLYGASCVGSNCTASGNYANTTSPPDYLPLLFQSKDSGLTWRYIDTTVVNAVPSFGDYNNLISTICFGTNVCASVGNYSSSDLTPLSLLTNTANNSLFGRAWTSLSLTQIRNLPPITTGTFNDIAVTS